MEATFKTPPVALVPLLQIWNSLCMEGKVIGLDTVKVNEKPTSIFKPGPEHDVKLLGLNAAFCPKG